MNTISFEAKPLRSIPVRQRFSTANLSRTDKIKRTLQKGLTIDKLPETGFIVGLILPLPLTSIILPSIGAIIKYSYKSYKWLQKKEQHFNRIV